MKRLLACLLALLLLLSALPLAGAAFSDEASIDAKFKSAVAEMSEKGIIGGFPDGSFGPKKTLTRAQAAKIICVMLEGEEGANALTKTETGFADVPASHWAAKFVAYCADKGIVAGVGDGKFDPDGKLSSAAFAKMLLVAYGADASAMTGKGWIEGVRQTAAPTFLAYNLKEFSTVSLPRQEACQMAFNAIFGAEAKADREKGDPRTVPAGVPETVKLFIIGHSYGNDCTLAYLYQLLKDAGVKNVVIGTLYYSGCPYKKHIDFALQNKPVYAYYKNTDGKLVTTKETTFDKSIGDEQWTHILMLHGFVGKDDDFAPCPWQDLVLWYARRTQPDAYYGYIMTWAFRTDIKLRDSHQANFNLYYGGDAQKMYESQVDKVKRYAEPEQRFKYIVPAGTSIMNARTSFLGCGVHRDNMSHLNKGIGRYIAAMTVCCKLTGVSPDQLTYLPESLLDNLPEGLDKNTPGLLDTLGKIARESVKNTMAKPYEITQSTYTTKP